MAMERVVRTTCIRQVYSVLAWDVQAGSVAFPSEIAVLDEPLEESNRITVRISASLKRYKNQCRDREVVGRCVLGFRL